MRYHNQNFYSSIPQEMRVFVVIRACIGATTLFLSNFSMYYLPLSQVVIIRNISPFLASFFGYLINGERVTFLEIFGLLACFTGIVLFAISKSREEKSKNGISSSEYLFGISAILLASTLIGLVTPLVRKMKSVHYTVIANSVNVVNFTLFSTVTLINFDSLQELRSKVPSEQFGFMTLAALILVCSHLILTQA